MKRDKLGHRHSMIPRSYLYGISMYIACLCPNLLSVHFHAIPILSECAIPQECNPWRDIVRIGDE